MKTIKNKAFRLLWLRGYNITIMGKPLRKNVSELIESIELLQPDEKILVLRSLQKPEELTEKDIKIMEWSLDVIKEAKKNNTLLQDGLKILNRALERQNKKS